MGAVYKAKDSELERVIALKVIRPELASNPEVLRRFKQETILARQISDRNVIRIFDFGEAEGVRFITMQQSAGLLRESTDIVVAVNRIRYGRIWLAARLIIRSPQP